MKVLTLTFLLLLAGCFPGKGGYVEIFGEEGATTPDDPYPQDTLAIISFFTRFQAVTPVLAPPDLDTICARADVETQQVNGIRLTTSFLEDGIDQTFMAINPTVGIYNKTIVFNPESATFKEFFDIDFNPIPPPETIFPGTIVLVGVLATEDGNDSTRFTNTYLLKLDSGNYIWYGNQNPSPNVQKAIDYGVYDYLDEFQNKTPESNPTNMNDYFAIIGDPDQTIFLSNLPNDFLEYGVDQTQMFTDPLNLEDKTVVFNFRTVQIKKFLDITGAEIPEPGADNILPGTIVQVGIEATEDDTASTRFSDMFLVFLDSGKYVWFGNQLVTPI